MDNALEQKNNTDKTLNKEELIKKDEYKKGFEEAMKFIENKLHKNI